MTSLAGPRVAFFGGSFDPPHVAHVLLATLVLKTQPIDEVVVAPVLEHAFGKRLLPFAERLRLCELAFAGIAGVTISAIEAELSPPSRSLLTLQRLAEVRPGATFRLLTGSDVLGDLPQWYAFEQLLAFAPLLVVERPGFPVEGAALALPDISSTHVRELLLRRNDADLAELAQLLPHEVLRHVLEHDLYPAVRN